MVLVEYSDSDASDVEEPSKIAVKPANPSKPTFQKVVDRSNPGKIRVSLPLAALKDDTESVEPPKKKARTGGGAFSGFNSLLPPPKHSGQKAAAVVGGNVSNKGLGRGTILKTGAAPSFGREPEFETENAEDRYEDENQEQSTSSRSGFSLPVPKPAQNGYQKPADEVKAIGKPLLFKPLSVARKPANKKKQAASAPPRASPTVITSATTQPEKPKQRARVSLFSISAEPTISTVPQSTGDYQPILYESYEGEEKAVDDDELEPSYEDYTPTTTHTQPPPAVPTPPISQSLDDIAGDLNLSAAERRQLFGRQKGGQSMQSARKVINFNTDEEYLRNEELRTAGEQVVLNPVRAIAPGKHSLKQLVNAVQSQREALEESFAKGKNNRAEASSRYGW
jgi:hypothetical protein